MIVFGCFYQFETSYLCCASSTIGLKGEKKKIVYQGVGNGNKEKVGTESRVITHTHSNESRERARAKRVELASGAEATNKTKLKSNKYLKR